MFYLLAGVYIIEINKPSVMPNKNFIPFFQNKSFKGNSLANVIFYIVKTNKNKNKNGLMPFSLAFIGYLIIFYSKNI